MDNNEIYTCIPATSYGLSGTNLVYNSTFGSASIANGATSNSNYAYGPRVIQLGARFVF